MSVLRISAVVHSTDHDAAVQWYQLLLGMPPAHEFAIGDLDLTVTVFPGLAADPADPGAVTRLIDRIAAEVGPPGVLVNTVGAFRPGDAIDTTPDTLRLMLDVNLGPALWLSQAVVPHMRQQGSGAIVHVTARPAWSLPAAWRPTA